MIVVDINILIYAIDRNSSHHDQARTWWELQMSSATAIGLPWLVVVGFIRLITNRRVMREPLEVDTAIAVVDEWLAQPHVDVVHPGPDHWSTLCRLLARSGTAGNLTNDAHIAALAIERNALVCSADHDFMRFEGVQYFNPFQQEGVREPRLAYV